MTPGQRRAAVVGIGALVAEAALSALFLRVSAGPLPVLLANGILAAFGILVLIDRGASLTRELGIDAPAPRGIAAGLLMAAPLALVLAATRDVLVFPRAAHLIRFALATALAEEIFYRGFVFRLLARRAGLGTLRAALITAVGFGLARVAAGAGEVPPLALAESALLGAASAGWLAWLMAAWGDSLWVPLALHFGMYLGWGAFEGALVMDGPDLTGQIARLASVAASVAITLVARRRRWTGAP